MKKEGGGSIIPAVICTAGGVAGLGIGGYFLFSLFSSSLPAYNAATVQYNDAGLGADFEVLYADRLTAYDAAQKDMLIGSIAAGAGIILTAVGIILFPPPAENSGTEISMAPVVTGNPGLIVRVSY